MLSTLSAEMTEATALRQDNLRRDGAVSGEGHEGDLTWTSWTMRFLERHNEQVEQYSSSRIEEPKETKTIEGAAILCSCNPVQLQSCVAETLEQL